MNCSTNASKVGSCASMRIACLASLLWRIVRKRGGGIVALLAKRRIEEQLTGHSMSRREKLILFWPGRGGEIVLHMEKGG